MDGDVTCKATEKKTRNAENKQKNTKVYNQAPCLGNKTMSKGDVINAKKQNKKIFPVLL